MQNTTDIGIIVQPILQPRTKPVEKQPQNEITFFRILQTRRKREVAYIRHVSSLRKHGDLEISSCEPRSSYPILLKITRELYTLGFRPKQR